MAKLLREEIKAFGKVMLLLYAAAACMAFITGAGIRVMNWWGAFKDLNGAFFILIFASLIIAEIIMPGILSARRFCRYLLPDEKDGKDGMRPAPVKAHQGILAGLFSTFFWTLMSVVSIAFTFLIIAWTAASGHNSLHFFRRGILNIRMLMLGKKPGPVLIWIVVFILSYAALLLQIYAALAIGHQWPAHRTFAGMTAFCGTALLRYASGRVLGLLGYDMGLMDLVGIWMNGESLPGRQALWVIILYHAALIAVFGAAAWYYFDRRLKKEKS